MLASCPLSVERTGFEKAQRSMLACRTPHTEAEVWADWAEHKAVGVLGVHNQAEAALQCRSSLLVRLLRWECYPV